MAFWAFDTLIRKGMPCQLSVNYGPGKMVKMLRRFTRRAYRYRGFARLAEAVRKRYAAYGKPIVIDDFDGDMRFLCRLNEHMGSQIFWRGFYSGEQLALLDRIARPEDWFVDVGANQGEFTVFMAKRLTRGRVISFEASPGHYARLCDNVRLNGLPNVQTVNVALSNATGRVQMFDREEQFDDGTFNEGLATLYPSAARGTPAGEIDAVTLDDWAASISLPRLDLLKIDVEGAELSVLHGAREIISSHRPAILVEVNRDTCAAAGYEATAICRFLTDAGYVLNIVRADGGLVPIAERDLSVFQNVFAHPGEKAFRLAK